MTHCFWTVAISAVALLPIRLHSAASTLGELSQYIQAGSSGAWNIQEDGSAVYLSNQNSANDILYFYTQSKPQDEGSRSISIDVAFGSSTTNSLAGLLYGYREKPKSYFTVTVGGDRSINIHQMQGGYLEELDKIPLENLQADRTTLLLEESGNTVTLSVNGQILNTYTDDHLGRGAVGIVAVDIGQYKFSNFKLSSEQSVAFESNSANFPGNTPPQANTAVKPASAGSQKAEVSVTRSKEAIKYFPTPDRRFNGMASHYFPFPSSWTQLTDNKDYLFEGPNGVKISGSFGYSNQYTNNPDGLQILSMQGAKNVPPYSVQQIIDEHFMPIAKKEKRELIKTYPLPNYAQNLANYQARLFKSVPSKESVEAFATEWRDQSGKSYALVVSIVISEAFPTSFWYWQGELIEADNAHFASSRDAYFYGLEHVEVNPKWLSLVNRKDAQRAGKSWADHNSRMNAIKARAKSSRSVADIYSEISDISHAGYLKRSDIQSHGHAASVRTANETSLISDHNTGEHYQVEGNDNYHWVNSNGVHISTDNSLFDPRTDEQLNILEWTQFQKE